MAFYVQSCVRFRGDEPDTLKAYWAKNLTAQLYTLDSISAQVTSAIPHAPSMLAHDTG
jgi:hypothetical protein